MTAAARKKPTEESAPPDDPRAALRAAKDLSMAGNLRAGVASGFG